MRKYLLCISVILCVISGCKIKDRSEIELRIKQNLLKSILGVCYIVNGENERGILVVTEAAREVGTALDTWNGVLPELDTDAKKMFESMWTEVNFSVELNEKEALLKEYLFYGYKTMLLCPEQGKEPSVQKHGLANYFFEMIKVLGTEKLDTDDPRVYLELFDRRTINNLKNTFFRSLSEGKTSASNDILNNTK